MNNFETIIGVEVHAELNTKQKIFSPAKNNINDKPNTNVHPIDLGLPGTLPQFNNEVLEKALLITKALQMNITKEMHWDRKNYFYHDNPKGYQITQFDTPIGTKGYIKLTDGTKIGIDFMHMEEDTAKTFNNGNEILLDYNRCGVPLVEIVSSPELRSGVQTREYLEKLREILIYLDVCDGKLEEGSFRVDVNVSIRPLGAQNLNTKVEIKNLNSLANVQKAIELEQTEQIKKYIIGEKVQLCTKRFDENTKKLVVMRVKENVSDYRYFSEPDLPLITLTDEYILQKTQTIPLLPQAIRTTLINDYQLNTKEVEILLANKEMTKFFLKTLQEKELEPQQSLNYLLVNVNEYLNKEKVEFKETFLTIIDLIQINKLLKQGEISTNHVKKLIPQLLKEKITAVELVDKLGIKQITDPKVITQMIEEVLTDNPDSIELYKAGKERAFGFLIGQTIKKSKGQANPKLVNEILKKKLDEY
ncbi:MAG: Asp-tRNA(Asn)/Glu-tRNA(Gln) amidotransferase subunit GatB [Mycoplasmatales bacterium]